MKKILVSTIILICLACLIVFGYYVVIPSLDRSICVRQVSQRLGIEMSYENIIKYVYSSISSGMSRNEVEIILKKLGPLEIHHEGTGGISTLETDSIWIKMCSNPFNNFWIFIHYTTDDKLDSFFFEGD